MSCSDVTTTKDPVSDLEIHVCTCSDTIKIAAVISEAGTKEFDSKMVEITKLLQYWANDIPVDIIRKDCSSNYKEIREDGETNDDDHEGGVNE